MQENIELIREVLEAAQLKSIAGSGSAMFALAEINRELLAIEDAEKAEKGELAHG